MANYKYDVFVSYARVNNSSGWVSNFREQLRKKLDQRLGRIGAAKWFVDTSSISGNRQVTSAIFRGADESATLLILMSPGYLASPWCAEERNRFIEAVGDERKLDGRIFVAYCEPVDADAIPSPLAQFNGYPFYQIDPEFGCPCTLSPGDTEYDRQLSRLRWDLARSLISMASDKTAGVARVE